MSKLSRVVGPSVVLVMAALAWSGWPAGSVAQDAAPAGPGDAVASPVVADRFAVPAGDAATLLQFIEGLASPGQGFEDRQQAEQYLDKASTAISVAADKVLAGEATDRQAVDALQWKVESLRIRELLGDRDAAQRRDAFFDRMLKDPRPAVAAMVAPMRLVSKLPLERWFRQTDAQRAQAVDDFVAGVKAAGPTVPQAQLLAEFCDMLSDTRDSGLALRAIDALGPTLAASTEPDVRQMAPVLAGIARRINLPGHKMELEGTLMDGTKLDWAKYRGKVVLVDFWASWCGPCRREVPNVLANYRAYHDKGFEVLGVCLDDDRDAAEQYIKEAGVLWPSLFGDTPKTRGWNHPMAEKYAVNGVPRAILVDQEGRVVDNVTPDGMQAGMMARGPVLGEQLRRLLGEPAGVGAGTRETALPDAGLPAHASGVEDAPARSSAIQPASENQRVSDAVPAAP
jgi:thiol-disulfide isomerase/thioredoxin